MYKCSYVFLQTVFISVYDQKLFRINAKDVFMGGGFLREYTVQDDYALNPDESYPDEDPYNENRY